MGNDTKLTVVIIRGLVVGSPWFLLFNQIDAMLAWWATIILLFPLLLISIKTKSTALIAICSITLLTQLITVPSFYILKENFQWGHVKPFGFHFTDAFPILAKVALYIAGLIVFYIMPRLISARSGHLKTKECIFLNGISPGKHSSIVIRQLSGAKLSGARGIYGIIIVAAILLLLPIHSWLFSIGATIVGVEPPELPYKLAGIFLYLTRYIIPLLLGYLYWKSSQSFPLTFLLIVYACVLGISSLSRSALIIVILPIAVLAWTNRRYILLSIIVFGTLVGYSAVTIARGLVHFVSLGKTGAFTHMGLYGLVNNLFSDQLDSITGLKFIFESFIALFERIDGFSNLVMAHWYDPSKVEGSFGFILRLLNRSFSPWNQDLHHLQWQGYVLPQGFVNCGGLLSTVVIVGNNGLYWIVLASLVSALTLLLLEASLMRLVRKYGLTDTLGNFAIVFMCIIYVIESGGSEVFFYPFVILSILAFMPKFVLVKRL